MSAGGRLQATRSEEAQSHEREIASAGELVAELREELVKERRERQQSEEAHAALKDERKGMLGKLMPRRSFGVGERTPMSERARSSASP